MIIKRILLLLMVCGLFTASDAYSGTVQLPQTGQSLSYGAGDDGALRKGFAWSAAIRFTDNGNGTITDKLSGLVWLKNANCTDTVGGIAKVNGYYLTWSDALAWSNNLANGKCGLSDGSTAGQWRLPNRKELQSLIDRAQINPALPTGHPFSGVQSDYYYWSSSTFAGGRDYGSVVGMVDDAWGVAMVDGKVTVHPKYDGGFVWPVQGGW